MKQTSEPGVQPRRNILGALWVWAIGLWSAPQLFAADDNKHKAASCEDKYQLTLLIGRLCIDSAFRDDFFKLREVEDKERPRKVKEFLEKEPKMPSSPELEAKVEKILKAHKSPENPIQSACYDVESALTMAQVSGFPCPWPC